MRQWLINLFWHWPVAVLANVLWDFPGRKLKVIGVTGTSGKTSTCHWLYHFMSRAGFKVGLISTVSSPGLHVTNPGPMALQKLIHGYVKKNFDWLILEVTSHGLDQHRCWGILFSYGVLTNITHEHLDYHRTRENYRRAKLKLVKAARVAVLNRDDPSFKPAQAAAKGRVLSFSGKPDFNAANIQAAAAVAVDLGISQDEINRAVKSFPGVTGRMETIQTKPFRLVIDFAHKPDALEQALKWLRPESPGRLIAVFGAAGLRDRAKRPLMGGISARLAEITVLTAEDPRTENVNDIIESIAGGYRGEKRPKNHRLIVEPDRQKAINLAVKLARPGDTVALFGKAHEKSMCFGKIEYPWSEHRAALKALKLRKEAK